MSELDLEKIREEISTDVLLHIRECEVNKIIQHYVIKTFSGSGKTTSIMKAIDEAGYNWIYFCAFHDIIRENLEYSKLRDYEFIHLKGKSQEGVCVVPEFKKYAEMGISIDPFCETRCIYKRSGCPYYETRRKIESYPESWAGVHSHVPTYLQKFLYQIRYKDKQMFKHYDVLIIDEFPFQVLFNQEIIQRRDIEYLIKVLDKMETKSPEKDFIINFLNEFTPVKINYRRIWWLLNIRRSLDLKKFLKEYDATLLRLISNKTIDYPPKNLIFNCMVIYKDNPSIEKLKWIIYKHDWDGWSPSGIYVTTSNIHYFKNIPIPIIALDATADVSAWNTLLGDNCECKEIDMAYKNLYQLRSSARYPVSTWIEQQFFCKKCKLKLKRQKKNYICNKCGLEGEINQIKNECYSKKVLSNSGERLSDLILQICSRKKNSILLCSNKRIEKLIREFLLKYYKDKNYMFATYYNLRSRNSFYEECDTCIIVHEPNIPPLQLEIMENVIGWDVGLLRELMTTSEIKQAIGRVRQNILITPDGRKRENIEVFVFPGAIKDDKKILEEAKLITYDNMYVGKLQTLRSSLIETIKLLKNTNIKELRNYYTDVSFKDLKSEIKKLYLDNYIDDYKRNIEWVYDEEKAKKVDYKRVISKHLYI